MKDVWNEIIEAIPAINELGQWLVVALGVLLGTILVCLM